MSNGIDIDMFICIGRVIDCVVCDNYVARIFLWDGDMILYLLFSIVFVFVCVCVCMLDIIKIIILIVVVEILCDLFKFKPIYLRQ